MARSTKPEAKPMQFHKGWRYETPKVLYQLWPPDPAPRAHREPRTNWVAGWTERRDMPGSYYLEDQDDGWRPEGDFAHGATPAQAMACFPTNDQAEQAKKALLRIALDG